MRAQRVALPPPDPTTNSTTRTATRVPLNPIASTNHGPSDGFSKTTNLGHSNTTHKHLPSTHPHGVNVLSSSEPMIPNRGFKPSRTASGSSQVAPPPTSHPVPTRPLPRRAIPESDRLSKGIQAFKVFKASSQIQSKVSPQSTACSCIIKTDSSHSCVWLTRRTSDSCPHSSSTIPCTRIKRSPRVKRAATRALRPLANLR
ncbi:uncharacterized protein MELLADRAFT_72610 [Melampsora larici-populina 98AG31]|uniref:Uncharacterized protein n=1 Tax=Melampsora larici-populina (strain 98AG31 / pathotype 3-4-7) TaxID=747676 RepID=F4RWK4_MELLP|nr:uncharacterized protein MELLADRAFT_72610 [Melampsora larici-populina 98AG31]EGG03297.1 hypothetical protein MELLADRAFT_72610 [Melampsora larici-populina 98AG31]